MQRLVSSYNRIVNNLLTLDGLPLLMIRLYLAPVFMQAGWNKIEHMESTIQWFGNVEWGLGLPMPEVLAYLAAYTELIGGALLVVGLATRIVAIPLSITMLVAAVTVHWKNGWLAISDANSWLANGTLILNERVMSAVDKKEAVTSLLKEYGNYDWLTSSGSITILNNGIEFAATYLLMTLCLLFFGAGRYTSVDYYLKRKLDAQKDALVM